METLPAGHFTTKYPECYHCFDSLAWDLCWRMVLPVLWGTASLNTHVSHLYMQYGSCMCNHIQFLLLHLQSGDKLGRALSLPFHCEALQWLLMPVLLLVPELDSTGAGYWVKGRGWQKQLDCAYCKRGQSPPNFRWSVLFRPLNWIREW